MRTDSRQSRGKADLVWLGSGPSLVTLKTTAQSSLVPRNFDWLASVVTSVNKTHRHLPNVHPDVYQQPIAGMSPELSLSRVWNVEGVQQPE